MQNKYVVWFKDVDKDDLALVGGKGANLGEMAKAGFPVPDGFVVTVPAYEEFLQQNNLARSINEILNKLDVNNNKKLEIAASKIQKTIIHAKVPVAIAQEIIRAYLKLGKLMQHARVAVRSSATAEDLPTASFAGQQATFLNVVGEANLIQKVKEAWASLFTSRAIFYRVTHKFNHQSVKIAIPVQLMVEAEKSGVLFTIDPVNSDKHKLIIEAVYGLGETIVQGSVSPDRYEIDKRTHEISAKDIQVQEKRLIWQNGKNILIKLTKTEGAKQKITDQEILELAALGKRIESHYYFPQDIEWAMAKGKIFIVQTRPITTIKKNEQVEDKLRETKQKELILKGDPASPGIATGVVQIIKSAKEINKINQGEILVTEQTNPDFVPAMRKAGAIVTERGGRTSHAAIVSRELGIPAVVGAPQAMQLLKNGQVISVNGATGEIWKGAIKSTDRSIAHGLNRKAENNLKTATKVYVNLAEPSRAFEIAKNHVDGVGLLRAEFMIAGIGVHPKKMISEHREDEFIEHLRSQIETFCKAFNPRPVIYRTTDFKTNEYRNLAGGKAYEPEEPNPMLGFRGAARYVIDSQVFELELEAIKRIRNKSGYKNLWIMLPFVRTPEELLEVKKIIAGSGLLRSPSFKIWMMVEIPTNVIRLDDFLEVGIDGVSIGSNDLTMLILGTDRDNSEVAHDFSEMDKSVLWAIERVIKTALQKNVTISICGQAPSDYPELIEKLVKWGITSVSVNPDAIYHVRQTIAQAEAKVILKK